MPALATTTADFEWMRLRENLIRFLRGRGAADPEELAQEALVRVLVNLQGGTAVRHLEAYTYQVAINVLREDRRYVGRHLPLPEGVPAQTHDRNGDSLGHTVALCKRQILSREEVELIEAYYPPRPGAPTDRTALALQLGLTPSALYLRVFRIRRKLQRCVGCHSRAERLAGRTTI